MQRVLLQNDAGPSDTLVEVCLDHAFLHPKHVNREQLDVPPCNFFISSSYSLLQRLSLAHTAAVLHKAAQDAVLMLQGQMHVVRQWLQALWPPSLAT